MRSVLGITLVLLIIVINAVSEPSNEITWLMDEPVSLFDKGMERLTRVHEQNYVPELAAVLDSTLDLSMSDYSGSVIYSWDDNEIIVGANFIGDPNEEMCKLILEKYKDSLPFLEEYSGTSIIEHMFGHIDHMSGTRPASLGESLISIMKIEVRIREPYSVGYKSIMCNCATNDSLVTVKKFG